MKCFFPNYDNSLTSVANSILKEFKVPTFHNSLELLDNYLAKKDYKNIIIILYDGMGSNILKRNLKEDSFLLKHKITDINSVFPATTTAATTTLKTGLNPVEHGWLGWDLYFKNEDEIVTMFTNEIKDTNTLYSEDSLALKYYPYTSIFDLINKTNNKAIEISHYSDNSYTDLEDMHNKIIKISNEPGKKYIYAYYEEPDSTTHIKTSSSKEVKDIYENINDLTEKLCNELTDSLIIVTSDHGHITSTPITLSDYPAIFNTLDKTTALEPRACSFFIKKGQFMKFEDLFQKYFSNDFILYRKSELIKDKVFGPGNKCENFKSSLGNYLAVAKGKRYFRYDQSSADFKSMHAGITEEEMFIPLIIIEK